MIGDENQESVFRPWYEYLSAFELLIHSVVILSMALILWAGFTGLADMRVATGIVLFFAVWVTFLTKWSISLQRTASLTAFENE